MPSSGPSIRTLQGRAAAAVRWQSPDKDDAARDLATARIEKYVREVVAKAPPLSDAQRERLAVLLRDGAE